MNKDETMNQSEHQQIRLNLEKAMQLAGRLPPGQAATLKFPVLHAGPVPQFDPATWDLRIFGEVEEEQRWTWEDFKNLPRSQITMDIHCVTRWSKFDTTWEGVSLKSLIDVGLIRLTPKARYLVQHCEYGFTVNLPLEVAMQPNFLLATHYNGQPLEPEHGYPLRGVIGAIPGGPHKATYLWKGGKWLRSLEFLSHNRLGYWELIGFHNGADVWQQERQGPVENVL